jgi:polyphosphate glucokinase
VTAGRALGIDVGGTGVKGAPVDLGTGRLAAERLRIPTPRPATPQAVTEVVAQIGEHFAADLGDGPVGVAVPGVVTHGRVRTAANIDPSWIGLDADRLISTRLGREVRMINDADAAGLAEAHYGAARGQPGLVLMTTLGTGIGSALLLDGRLVPNSELGHLEIAGHDAESRAAAAARENEGLSWERWAERLQQYYRAVEDLLWPDLIVIGGGISKKADKFLPLIDIRTPIAVAVLRNQAGIVGAALRAAGEPTQAPDRDGGPGPIGPEPWP